MVQSLYNKLVEIVEEEALCLERFLSLLVDQQKYLVENDIDSLKEGVSHQQEIINRIKMLEKSRGQLVSRFSESLDLNPRDITISSLARKAEGQIADKLLGLQNALLSLHQKIEKARRKNEFLIEHSMKYIEGTIRLIARQTDDKRDYAPRRKKQESMIVSRTV